MCSKDKLDELHRLLKECVQLRNSIDELKKSFPAPSIGEQNITKLKYAPTADISYVICPKDRVEIKSDPCNVFNGKKSMSGEEFCKLVKRVDKVYPIFDKLYSTYTEHISEPEFGIYKSRFLLLKRPIGDKVQVLDYDPWGDVDVGCWESEAIKQNFVRHAAARRIQKHVREWLYMKKSV